MTLTITKVPDAKAFLGPSQFEETFQIQPGVSDYPTNGYTITAAQLSLGNIYGAWEICGNAAAAAYKPKVVLPAGSFGSVPSPASTFNLEITQADSQVAANTDLSGCIWFIRVNAVNP